MCYARSVQPPSSGMVDGYVQDTCLGEGFAPKHKTPRILEPHLQPVRGIDNVT